MLPPRISKLTLETCSKPGEFGGNETVCLFEAGSCKPKQLLLYLLGPRATLEEAQLPRARRAG